MYVDMYQYLDDAKNMHEHVSAQLQVSFFWQHANLSFFLVSAIDYDVVRAGMMQLFSAKACFNDACAWHRFSIA